MKAVPVLHGLYFLSIMASMEEKYLFAFCYRQSRFISILCNLHIIKENGLMELYHPITNKLEGYVQRCYIPKIFARLIEYIDLNIVDEDGSAAMDRLKACNLIDFH